VHRASTMEPAAANGSAAAEPTVETGSATTIDGRPAAFKSRPAAVEPATAVVASTEPRTRADKSAPDKVVRAIVAVRRACIRGIPIVAVGADRSWPDVAWHNSNSHPNLCMGRAPHNHAKPEQNRIS
jgi:hypothetical protein